MVLDSRMLRTRDSSYHDVLKAFESGDTLYFDGVGFAIVDDEFVAAIYAPGADLSEDGAIELATHVDNVFDSLASGSEEFSSLVSGRQRRTSVLSSVGDRELYRVTDGGSLERMS